MFRIGFGYDAHGLAEGRPLIIGGVKIPWESGLMGHSDADVLIHAIIDAILGALGRGDIGGHFPDTDPTYKDMDSIMMLGRIIDLMESDGYEINNIDGTIVAQRPKIAPFIPDMKERLSAAMDIQPGQVNIKATTTEGMGFIGRGEGIEAYAVVSLVKKNDNKII
jgi:2-C-methyl-D-erythritol 2,4-cyclodiphosphate synthase